MYTLSVQKYQILVLELGNKIIDSKNNPEVIKQIKNEYFEAKSKVDPKEIDNLDPTIKEIIVKFENSIRGLGFKGDFSNKGFLFVKYYLDTLTTFAKEQHTQKELFDEYEKVFTEYLSQKFKFIQDNPDVTDLSDLVNFEEEMRKLMARKNEKDFVFEA